MFASACDVVVAAAPPPPASPTTSNPGPTPIPVAKVPLEAGSTIAVLQEINARSSRDQSTANLIAASLANLASEIDARMSDDTRLLEGSQSLDTLHRLTAIWDEIRDSLSTLTREVTKCAANLDQEIVRLDQLQKVWQLTLLSAQQPATPPAVLKRAQSIADSVEMTRKMAESGRGNVLTIQTRLSEEEARVQTFLSSLAERQSSTLKSLMVRDSPPLWHLGRDLGKNWKSRLPETFSSQLTASGAFAQRLPLTFLVHGLVILLIAAALQWMRRKISKSPEKIQDLPRAMPIFELPVSSAFALSIVIVPSIYPQAPRLVQAGMGALALIPTINLLRRLMHPNYYPVLNALAVMYFVGQLRMLAASYPEVARLIFLGQVLGASIFLWWLIRSSHLRNTGVEAGHRTWQVIHTIAKIGLVLLPAALFLDILGYVNLGNLLGIVFLRSMFVAAALYIAIRIIEGLVIVGLQVRPIGSLRGVKLHRVMLQQRICRLLEVLAFLFWLSETLNFFGIREPLISAIQAGIAQLVR